MQEVAEAYNRERGTWHESRDIGSTGGGGGGPLGRRAPRSMTLDAYESLMRLKRIFSTSLRRIGDELARRLLVARRGAWL